MKKRCRSERCRVAGHHRIKYCGQTGRYYDPITGIAAYPQTILEMKKAQGLLGNADKENRDTNNISKGIT